jgi:hypothetical protein
MSSIFTQIYIGTILAFILGFAKLGKTKLGFAKLGNANRQFWLKAFLAIFLCRPPRSCAERSSI